MINYNSHLTFMCIVQERERQKITDVGIFSKNYSLELAMCVYIKNYHSFNFLLLISPNFPNISTYFAKEL